MYKGTLEYLGNEQYDQKLVAVKKLKSNAIASCLQDFEREINIMKVNILQFSYRKNMHKTNILGDSEKFKKSNCVVYILCIF